MIEGIDLPNNLESKKRINITLQRAEVLGKNKIKVKIKETNVNLTTMTHAGIDHTVLKNLGRGRYIMRVT